MEVDYVEGLSSKGGISTESKRPKKLIEGSAGDFTFDSALFEPKGGTATSVESVFPNTRSKFRSFENAPELQHWNVDPYLYSQFMKQFFKVVDMRVSLLLSPYFLESMDQGVNNALIEYMRTFNDKIKGKLLFCKTHQIQSTKALIVPELKGLISVSVIGQFFSFIPKVGEQIYCDITSLDKDQGVATILKLATVRFSPKILLEPFMKWSHGSWTFESEEEGLLKLEKRDVLCVTIVKVGTEDYEGHLMEVEVEAKREIIVLKEEGHRYVVKERDQEEEMGEKETKKKKRKKSTKVSK